ncbi:hypothetical protein [Nonomuraea pusilla]|uniref:4-amino-4-deoxy-L-arabinose transferase n=1 Tax=Nonomuraea pusilla TaxID=46177 RepID=A0A1H8J9P6_9ACTN|nr:hypothetical protein [Nonomuraea pusilla]SEN77165.1 hypothetical protein SAMN05660976_08279 [Nonomuraea pusilla]
MSIASIARAPARPSAPVAGARPRRGWRLLLLGGWLAQVLLRLWLFRDHTGPVANPDETGYLVAARWLAGGVGGDLSGSTFYQGGYALLLVPVFWVTDDPVTAYRLVVVIGSAVAAGAFLPAYLLLRRLEVGRRFAAVAAFTATLSPSLLLFSGLALADAVLPTLVLGWLVAVHDLVRTGSVRAGAAAGALAGYAMAVHLRGTVLLTVLLAVCLLTAARLLLTRRRTPARATPAPTPTPATPTPAPATPVPATPAPVPAPTPAPATPATWRGAGVAAGAAVLVAGAGMLLNRALSAGLYPDGPRDLSGLLVSRLTTLDGQAWAVSGALGQLWYLIAGTWGLAGVGLAGAVTLVARRSGPPAHRVAAAALLALTLGVAYASSAALPDEHRVGNYAYGRYLACVATAWVLAGLLVLVRARRGAVVAHAVAGAALMAAAGGLAAWYAGDRLHRYAFIAFDFPEVMFLNGVRDRLDLAGASWAALALLACLTAAAVAAPGPRLATAVLAVVNVAFVVHLAPAAAPPPGRDWLPAPGPGRVALDTRVRWNVWVPLTYRVWWTELERFDGRRGAPPAGACGAVVPWDAGAPPSPWTVAAPGGRDGGWTLWTNAGNPSCRAGAGGR